MTEVPEALGLPDNGTATENDFAALFKDPEMRRTTTRVVVLPSDETACGFYRMRLPAGAVQQVRPDWSVEVYRPSDVKMGVDIDGNLMQVLGIPDPQGTDLLVMQRVATKAQAQFVKWMQQQGVATVTDSDDAMWCIDKENSAWEYWNSGKGAQHWRWLDTASETADLTTVTTKHLEKRYGGHGRCEVLPNCVPADLHEMIQPVRDSLDPTTTVGWAGFTSTHPGDLRVCGDAVKRAQDDTGCIVRVIGDAEGAGKEWGLLAEAVRPVPLGPEYYTALTTLDIGLVPLADTPFNRGKSYLKALEFAAAGVCVIASPTPANWELARHVPMELARTPAEWYEAIVKLVTASPEFRMDRAYYAREAVLKHHTYEVNAERWAVAWQRAMDRRARMSA